MTQRQLADELHVDQGTVSRWERGVEAPRPARRAKIQQMLVREHSQRALQRCVAFVRQDYLPSTLLDSKLRIVEISDSGRRHFMERGQNPDAFLGVTLERYTERFEAHSVYDNVLKSGMINGDCLLLRFVRNYSGRGHATVYEPIFEGAKLIGVLNYVTDYFALPPNNGASTELIEVVHTGDLNKAQTIYSGPNWRAAARAIRRHQI